MALKLLNTWGHTERPWGYEVRVDYADDDGEIYNEVLTFKAEPDAGALTAASDTRLATVERRIADVAAVEPEQTREELQTRVVELEAEVATLEDRLALTSVSR